MNRVINLINKFSFSRKLAFTFFFFSLLTFIIINITLHVLYSTVVISTKSDSILDTEAFSQFTNIEILSNVESYLLLGMDNYQQIVTNSYNIYQEFMKDNTIYKSNQKRGRNPGLTSSFSTPRYDRSSIYFFSQNSTFYDHPFLDKILASSTTNHYPSMLKRINIIYQSKTDPTDISIRTLPATKDFYVPNVQAITKKIQDCVPGAISDSNWYFDELSLSDNTTQLLSIKFLLPTANYNLLFEVQIKQQIVSLALKNVFSFPYTKLIVIKEMNNHTEYSILGNNTEIPESIDIRQFIKQGSKTVVLDGYQFLATTKNIMDDNNYIKEDADDTIDQTDLKLIIFVNKTQTKLHNTIYTNFLANEHSTLVFVLYGWSFIVLLLVAAIGVVIGDIIFSYFSLIRKKCRQYLQNPEDINQIERQMKQFYRSEQKNKVLFENIVQIMKGIENKKRQNRKNYKINYDEYPLNPLGIGFQNRMGLKDYNKFQEISHLIKLKQQNMCK